MNADIQLYARTAPQYQEALGFLQGVFTFQTSLMERLETGPPIDRAAANEKWQLGQCLLTSDSPEIPLPLCREAVSMLAALCPPDGAARATLDSVLASEVLISADDTAWLHGLVDSVVHHPRHNGDVQRLAAATSADPDLLAALLREVLSPFFQKWAAPAREWIATAPWRRGNCPVCGSLPFMARLDREGGRRILGCSLCHTEWPFDRLRCPFCDEANHIHLRFFAVEGDETHRVDCCDRCHRYYKTVNERALGHRANLLVEDVVTAHLDVLATEHGYS